MENNESKDSSKIFDGNYLNMKCSFILFSSRSLAKRFRGNVSILNSKTILRVVANVCLNIEMFFQFRHFRLECYT